MPPAIVGAMLPLTPVTPNVTAPGLAAPRAGLTVVVRLTFCADAEYGVIRSVTDRVVDTASTAPRSRVPLRAKPRWSRAVSVPVTASISGLPGLGAMVAVGPP